MINYPNKQIRLKKYDYSQPGYYFVTVCTKDRVEYFGKVENGKMLNPIINSIKSNNICIAVGPESGWSVNDLEVFKKNNFQFVTLKGNILRTETVSIVVSSIIKNIKGEI